MKDFPTKLTPDNISNFKQFRTNRNICKLKQIRLLRHHLLEALLIHFLNFLHLLL